MTLVIAVDRDSLSEDPLMIYGSRAAAVTDGTGLWVPPGGYRRPTFPVRNTLAPASAYQPGRRVLATVLDQGQWQLELRLTAASAAALADLRADVESAFSQYGFDVAVSLDGVVETWKCDPSWPVFPASPQWQRDGHTDYCRLAVPVRPGQE